MGLGCSMHYVECVSNKVSSLQNCPLRAELQWLELVTDQEIPFADRMSEMSLSSTTWSSQPSLWLPFNSFKFLRSRKNLKLPGNYIASHSY